MAQKNPEQQSNDVTRREFLAGSAAALASLASVGVFTEAVGKTFSKNDTITAAIIGTGNQGCFLLERAVKLPGVRFVACCDIQENNLAKGLSIAKDAKGYKDYQQVLGRQDIDAVLIATPLYLHAPMTIDALRSGKHVFCEKMMAYSIEDAKRMIRAARQTGLVLQIGHQRRYDPDYQHAYKLIKDGILGRITHVRAHWNRNASWRRPCPDPKLDELINWRLYRRCSQGLMAELGSHQIDVVNWMLEETPSAVVGVGGIDYWKDGREVYDNVQCIFEYPSGVKFIYQSITSNQYDGCYEQIMGDKGTMVLQIGKALLFREPKAEQLVWQDMAHKEKVQGKEAIVLDASKTTRLQEQRGEGERVGSAQKGTKDAVVLELEDFFRCVREGGQPLSTGKTALGACVAAIKANEAMDKMQRITIPREVYMV
ncbi:MAG: Gfo/Idh/MocA family oxidoreductase [Armatimonadota bacterium]|nr:Gfo/Idh/MocA family oxidoreductase [Armatimonadota bacterium]